MELIADLLFYYGNLVSLVSGAATGVEGGGPPRASKWACQLDDKPNFRSGLNQFASNHCDN